MTKQLVTTAPPPLPEDEAYLLKMYRRLHRNDKPLVILYVEAAASVSPPELPPNVIRFPSRI